MSGYGDDGPSDPSSHVHVESGMSTSSSTAVSGAVPNGSITPQEHLAPVIKVLPRQYSQCEFPDLVALIGNSSLPRVECTEKANVSQVEC